jgi:hypothetical protein
VSVQNPISGMTCVADHSAHILHLRRQIYLVEASRGIMKGDSALSQHSGQVIPYPRGPLEKCIVAKVSSKKVVTAHRETDIVVSEIAYYVRYSALQSKETGPPC